MLSIFARAYFAVIAIAWGVLVYGLHQGLGYERAYGYPSGEESLMWACLFLTPLVVVVLCIGSASAFAECVRLTAMALMSFVFLLTMFFGGPAMFAVVQGRVTDGLGIFAFVLLIFLAIGIWLLLVMDIRIEKKSIVQTHSSEAAVGGAIKHVCDIPAESESQ